jgi:hypothetical protein
VPNNYTQGARARAIQAHNESRPERQPRGSQPLLRAGIVEAVGAGGGYTVAALGDDGEPCDYFEQCFPFPEADLSEGEEVILWFQEGQTVPTILIASGGGCGSEGLTDFGVRVD